MGERRVIGREKGELVCTIRGAVGKDYKAAAGVRIVRPESCMVTAGTAQRLG